MAKSNQRRGRRKVSRDLSRRKRERDQKGRPKKREASVRECGEYSKQNGENFEREKSGTHSKADLENLLQITGGARLPKEIREGHILAKLYSFLRSGRVSFSIMLLVFVLGSFVVLYFFI